MWRRVLTVSAGMVIAITVSSCGSSPSNGLNQADSDVLLSELDQIRSFLAAGSCISAGSHAVTFLSEVQTLPADTDPDLRQALENGAQNLTVLLDDPANCSAPVPTTTTAPPTTTTTPSTTTTPPPTTTTTPTTTTAPGGGGSGGISP